MTALAFDTRTLAVPDDVPDRLAALVGLDVTGALPIDYVDGCRGVLTLLGKEPLAAVFDTVVELVDVLPELCSTVRERQTLALVKACDTILHDADVESRERPVPRDSSRELLSDVCGFIAFELHAAEVSVFLEDSTQPPGRYTLFAHSNGARAVEPCDPRQRTYIATDPADRTGFDPATGAPFMEVRLLERHPRRRARPLRRGRRAAAPLHDVRPGAAATGRRTAQPLLAHLAAPVGALGGERVVAPAGRRDDVAEQAGSRGTGPHGRGRGSGATGGRPRNADHVRGRPRVHRRRGLRTCRTAGVTELVAVAHTGNGIAAGLSRLAEQTVRGHRQLRRCRASGRRGRLADLYPDPRRGAGCSACSRRPGPAAAIPPNSAQINEIIGDQLGLYRHLHDTLGQPTRRARPPGACAADGGGGDGGPQAPAGEPVADRREPHGVGAARRPVRRTGSRGSSRPCAGCAAGRAAWPCPQACSRR